MVAYWLARAKINDPLEYKKYTDLVPAWVEARNPTHPDTPGVTYLTVCRKGKEPITHEFEWIDAVRLNFEAFADDINGIAPYQNTNEQKLQNIKTFEAICISAIQNRPVRVC